MQQYPIASVSQRILQDRSFRRMWYRVVDGATLGVSLVLLAAGGGIPSGSAGWTAAVTIMALYYVAAGVTGLYRSWQGASLAREMGCIVATWGILAAAVAAISWWGILPLSPQRPITLFWLLISPLALSAMRAWNRCVLATLRRHGLAVRRFAIVGVTPLGVQLARNIERSPELGLKCVGFFDDRPPTRTGSLPPDAGKRLGTIPELVQLAREGKVDNIYVTLPMRAEQRIQSVLDALADTTASVYLVPDFFVFELLSARWSDIGGLPVVSVFDHPFYGVDGLLKRVFDLVVAGTLLILLSPLLLAIAVAIKVTSPGPVFFRQRRYGLDGREFRVWKFRTMRVCEDGPVIRQASRNDDRITPIGRFLRRTSLDELPQLFNVLKGDMSLVGPRPHATAHNEQYRKLIRGYMLRHKARPGITGLAQVNGCRGETDTLEKMQRRVELDHQYIRQWSLWLDIKILLKTVVVVLRGDNAW